MTAQSTPEQRAECVREIALDLCRHPGLGITGGACGDCLRRVDAIFTAGYAVALEGADYQVRWRCPDHGLGCRRFMCPGRDRAVQERRYVLPWKPVQP